MKKIIDANKLIEDLKEWASSIKEIRDDGACFFTEENILYLINKQPEVDRKDLT